jgi:hypothetical protein
MLLNGSFPGQADRNSHTRNRPPTAGWNGLGWKGSSLTWGLKFDMFERFAQKRRYTQCNAVLAERNKFEDNLAERLGLDPKRAPLRRMSLKDL